MNGLSTPQKDWGEGGPFWIAPEQEQRADVIAAKYRSNQVRDLVPRPDEITLEIRQAELALMRLLDKTHQLAFVGCDLHGISPFYVLSSAPPGNEHFGRIAAIPADRT
jgi:hypothetical protein